MNGFLNILGEADTLELGGIVAFLVSNLGALLLYVIDSVTVLLVVERAHHLGSVVPHWPLGDLTRPFLSVSTDSVLDIVTLLSGHRLVGGFRDLIATYFGTCLQDFLGAG